MIATFILIVCVVQVYFFRCRRSVNDIISVAVSVQSHVSQSRHRRNQVQGEQMKVNQLTSKQLDTFRCPELPAVSSKSFYFADCSVFRVVAFTAAVESKQHTLELIRRRSLR